MSQAKLIKLFILFLVVAILIIVFWPFEKNRAESEMSQDSEFLYEPLVKYGIVIDSMTIQYGKVKKNQYLADILLSYDVNYPTINQLAWKAQPVFNVRKIRSGNPYAVLLTGDSIPALQYFVYNISLTEYVVFDLRDTLNVYRGSKEIRKVISTTTGVIESSLWNSFVENGTNPYLAVELSDIYAWAIDFFGIQKGDNYRIMFEELIVEDDTIGIGNIIAGCITHMGYDYYAYYFVQDSVGDYFDEEANSLRRTFLKSPLRYSRISSRFSHSRLHPILKIRRPHHGVDYAAPSGTPVHTIGDGVVIKKGFERRGGGRYIKIRHNGTYSTVYMHLSGYAKGIKNGSHVNQGDLIGYVGKTGLATGPHLDFRVYKNGEPIDPLKVKSPPAKPIDSVNRIQFDHLVRVLNLQLDTLGTHDLSRGF